MNRRLSIIEFKYNFENQFIIRTNYTFSVFRHLIDLYEIIFVNLANKYWQNQIKVKITLKFDKTRNYDL